MTTQATIGIIGLGIMGGAIAPNLVRAGFAVVGYDVDPARADTLASDGVRKAASVADLSGQAAVLLSSLPHEAALDSTVQAIIAAGVPGRVLIEMSTLPVAAKLAAAATLAAAGHVFLDCPLSGTGAQARTRDLTVYASGDSRAISDAGPIFDGFAKAWFDLGEVGNGSRMKYIANLLVFIHNVAAAEALTLAMKAGLDPARVIEVVRLGAGGSRMLEIRGPMMASGVYEPVTAGYPMYFKDLAIIGQFAADLGVPTPLLSAVLPIYLAGGNAFPGADVASVCGVLEAMAGVRRD